MHREVWIGAAMALALVACTHSGNADGSASPTTTLAEPVHAAPATAATDAVAPATRAAVLPADCGTPQEVSAHLAADLADLTWSEAMAGAGISDACLASLPYPEGFGQSPWPGPPPGPFTCVPEYPGTGNTRPAATSRCSARSEQLEITVDFARDAFGEGAPWIPWRVEVRPVGPYCPEPDAMAAGLERTTDLSVSWGPCLPRDAIDQLRRLGTMRRVGPCAPTADPAAA